MTKPAAKKIHQTRKRMHHQTFKHKLEIGTLKRRKKKKKKKRKRKRARTPSAQ